MLSSKQHRFGWVPDIPDSRDLLYAAVSPAIKLPAVVDLRENCSIVEDQGRLGSCTANALAGNIEFLDKDADQKYTDVSRLFIYYNERVIRGMTATDSGAMLRDGIKTLVKNGVCSEKIWPYVIERFTDKPTQKCYNEGLKHRILSYHRIQTLNEKLICLADGFPFVLGFTVYESFQSLEVAKTGIMNLPKKTERVLGGHAVLAVGYNLKDKRFIVRNSWGDQWGQKGYFTMPFDYMETLARDFWTIRK
ncbi:MAG: C1 family peptidase [Candidatus Omnitrophica bacterium]|nr:C1 family peptidase [Candidatus Omnitrophota bacterium]